MEIARKKRVPVFRKRKEGGHCPPSLASLFSLPCF
jgi:hypothetical protein